MLCKTLPEEEKGFSASTSSSDKLHLTLSVDEFPAKPADRRAFRDTVPKDYGAQTLTAFSHFFPWNLLDIMSHKTVTEAELACLRHVRVNMEVMRITLSVRIRLKIKSVKVSCIISCYNHG